MPSVCAPANEFRRRPAHGTHSKARDDCVSWPTSRRFMQPRTIFGRHYALAVVAIILVALLAAASVRSTTAVLMVPWGDAFGWSRSVISFAAACGIFLFGLTGPFAAAAMQRFGIRATVITALAMMSLSSFASLFM